MFCPKCGAQVEKDWKLCPKCGVKLILTPPPKVKAATSEEVKEALRTWAAPLAVSFVGLLFYGLLMSFFSSAITPLYGVSGFNDDAANYVWLIFLIAAGFAVLAVLKGKKNAILPAVVPGVLTFLMSLFFIIMTVLFFEESDEAYFNITALRFIGVGLLVGILPSVLIGLLARVRNPLILLAAEILPLAPVFLTALVMGIFGLPIIFFDIAMIFSGISLSLALLLPLFSYALPQRKK